MKIKMRLVSDAVFGNGVSVPGGEDISVHHDEMGFPCYPGSAWKGVFREELENYLSWTDREKNVEEIMNGISCSEFALSDFVKKKVLAEAEGEDIWQEILEMFTYLRMFTAIGEDDKGKDGSLRTCRCLIRGLVFYGTVECVPACEKLVREVLPGIRFIGTMRTRGMGHVEFEIVEG